MRKGTTDVYLVTGLALLLVSGLSRLAGERRKALGAVFGETVSTEEPSKMPVIPGIRRLHPSKVTRDMRNRRITGEIAPASLRGTPLERERMAASFPGISSGSSMNGGHPDRSTERSSGPSLSSTSSGGSTPAHQSEGWVYPAPGEWGGADR